MTQMLMILALCISSAAMAAEGTHLARLKPGFDAQECIDRILQVQGSGSLVNVSPSFGPERGPLVMLALGEVSSAATREIQALDCVAIFESIIDRRPAP